MGDVAILVLCGLVRLFFNEHRLQNEAHMEQPRELFQLVLK